MSEGEQPANAANHAGIISRADQNHDLLHTIFLMLGKIQQTVDDLRDSTSKQDGKLAELTERVRQNQHASVNTSQVLSGQVDQLAKSGRRVESLIGMLDKRVNKLEAPVAKALHARAVRRRMWLRVTAVAAAVGTFTWFFLEPFYRVVAETLIRKWFGGGAHG